MCFPHSSLRLFVPACLILVSLDFPYFISSVIFVFMSFSTGQRQKLSNKAFSNSTRGVPFTRWVSKTCSKEQLWLLPNFLYPLFQNEVLAQPRSQGLPSSHSERPWEWGWPVLYYSCWLNSLFASSQGPRAICHASGRTAQFTHGGLWHSRGTFMYFL